MTRGFSIFGDSISTLKGYIPETWRCHYEGEVSIEGIKAPDNTWWGQVIDHFNGTLISNSSFSGSVVEGFGFPAGVSDERVSHVVSSDGTKPDDVIIFMGINDYGWAGGRNQVMGKSLSASAKPEDLGEPFTVEPVASEEAAQRFEDAYALCIEKIQKLCPDARIWAVNLAPGTMPNATKPAFIYRIRGVEFDDYNTAIARACQRTGAHLVDVRAYGIDYDSVDGTHPSAQGMKQIAAMVIDQMEGNKADPSNLPELAGAPASKRGCFLENCHGCEYADIADNRWSLHCAKFD